MQNAAGQPLLSPCFSEELRRILYGRGKARALAMALGRSSSWPYQIRSGRRPPPRPPLIDKIVAALGLSPDERARLHWASARDHGFDVAIQGRADV